MSEELLTRGIDPFKFVLSYKFSQDHIELLFSCIRARGGFNNNPNTIQFKTALRQILIHNSITPGSSANVLSFEKTYNGSIFSLKTSTRLSPASEIMNAHFLDEEEDNACDTCNCKRVNDQDESSETENKEVMEPLFLQSEPSIFQEYVLYYITGYLVRQLLKELTCQLCSDALMVPVVTLEHQYSF